MRRTLAGIAMALVMLLSCGFASWLDEDASADRFQQHLVARGPDEGCDCDGSELCTHLPLVSISTNETEIPAVTADEPGTSQASQAHAPGSEEPQTAAGTISVVDHQSANNHPSDVPTLRSRIDIRTWEEGVENGMNPGKVSYLIHTTSDDGEIPYNVEMLGMDAFDEWLLVGPYQDTTLIRDYMWYNIAGEIMDYAPNVRFCEVILNDEYQGLYLMVETIAAGNGDARLDLGTSEADPAHPRYVVRMDEGNVDTSLNLVTFTNLSLRNLLTYDVVYPTSEDLTEETREYIQDDISAFEKALYSYDYDTEPYAYWEYVDVDSFVEYFLINELTCNYDAGTYSTYIYKNEAGRYAMCVWDFTGSCGNDSHADEAGYGESFRLQNTLLYYMLTKDESFVEDLVDCYTQLRQTFFSPEYLNNYIDEVIEYLGPAIERNSQIWGYAADETQAGGEKADASQATVSGAGVRQDYEKAVAELKDFLNDRIGWLDEHMDIILQYGHPSKVKRFNH